MSRPSTVPRPAPTGTFALWGDLADPVTLSVARLRRDWEQHRAEVVFDCATSGPQRHTFAGPLLREVVAATLPRFAPLRRKERSRFLLAVSGGDGHHTVMSWAEIDADFGNAPVLLATRMDDQDWTRPAPSSSSRPTGAARATSAPSPASGSAATPTTGPSRPGCDARAGLGRGTFRAP